MHYNIQPLAHYIPNWMKDFLLCIYITGWGVILGCQAGKNAARRGNYDEQLNESLLVTTDNNRNYGCAIGGFVGASVAMYYIYNSTQSPAESVQNVSNTNELSNEIPNSEQNSSFLGVT